MNEYGLSEEDLEIKTVKLPKAYFQWVILHLEQDGNPEYRKVAKLIKEQIK